MRIGLFIVCGFIELLFCCTTSAAPFAKGPYLGQTPPGPIAQVFAPGLICDTRPHRWEIHGHFSADGNTFCYRRLGYIYFTQNTDQGWTTPKRIKSIPYRAWPPCLSPGANSIYFTRSTGWNLNRYTDTADIYWVELKEHLPDPNDSGIINGIRGVYRSIRWSLE